MNNGLSDSDCEEDYEEINDDIEAIECLFCKNFSNSVNEALKHLESLHDFNFADFKIRHALDDYSYRKLINFIRKKEVSPEELCKLSTKTWDKEEYLKPICQDDPWLMLGTQRN